MFNPSSKAPLRPVFVVPTPWWVRTATAGGAFSVMSDLPSTSPAPEPPVPASNSPLAALPQPGPAPEPLPPELGFRPVPPPPPEQFPTLRSEDGRVALTNEALEINEEVFGWRELAGVDVQPVRWLLGVLLGGFVLCGFMLGYLQFWLHTTSAALGMAAGALLLVWGARGTNRWRLHLPGREPRHFAFSGPARSWQHLAQEANHRIRQRHQEAATEAAYWLQAAELPAWPEPEPPATL
ncbi:hypothetical protein K3G63_05225 [Hymenobacter sp. HSC-4F20]|uniref:hypothetical protein n=1 Tax=Hymenobacter sp. HSC-4F20 TaxID=2864135 RepID=UPI001C72D322|nr:hypothetical protein [Hymenobacter sp. HSC-4F20]MBX0289828.1 hypothetical protein [Hymenobacter sp. HSC-4F20]